MREHIYSVFKLNLKIQPDTTTTINWEKLWWLKTVFLFNENSDVSEFLFISNWSNGNYLLVAKNI